MSETPAVGAALFSWEEGLARLEEPGPLLRPRRRIVAEVQAELRRRVGATFSLADLARAYDASSEWYLPLAQRVAPATPAAWDPAVALDAAFGLYRARAQDS